MKLRPVRTLIVVLGVLVVTAAPGRADNFGASSGQYSDVALSDDSLVSWQYSTILPNRYRDSTAWTINNSYSTTDLNYLKYADGHREDLNNYYSVTNTMPVDGWIGFHDCIYWVSSISSHCKHAHIVYLNVDLKSTTYNKALSCHETGHSVGLRHFGVNATTPEVVRCMYNPVPRTDPWVGWHNTAHINQWY
jgi:hypothetical protein